MTSRWIDEVGSCSFYGRINLWDEMQQHIVSDGTTFRMTPMDFIDELLLDDIEFATKHNKLEGWQYESNAFSF